MCAMSPATYGPTTTTGPTTDRPLGARLDNFGVLAPSRGPPLQEGTFLGYLNPPAKGFPTKNQCFLPYSLLKNYIPMNGPSD